MELDQLNQSLLGDTKTAPGCQATETDEHHIDAFRTLILADTWMPTAQHDGTNKDRCVYVCKT